MDQARDSVPSTLGQHAARGGQEAVALPRFCTHLTCADRPGMPCLLVAGLTAPRPSDHCTSCGVAVVPSGSRDPLLPVKHITGQPFYCDEDVMAAYQASLSSKLSLSLGCSHDDG